MNNNDQSCICKGNLVINKKTVSRWAAFFICICFCFFVIGFFLGKKRILNTAVDALKSQAFADKIITTVYTQFQ